MLTLQESVVDESEIDELGHLSVPFYEARAMTGSHELLSRCGLEMGSLLDEGLELTLVDAFSRNLREQFLGATLAVQGGLLDASGNRVRLYQQIVNTKTDEIAAAYAQTFELQSREHRDTSSFDASVLAQLEDARINWPQQSQPRSLDLASRPFELTLEQAQRRELATRPARMIELDECNDEGYLESARVQHLPYSGAGSEDPTLQWVFELADGTRIGLADLETRNTLFSLPKRDDRIQVFSAEVALARKTLRRGYWVFDLNTATLISAGSVVMACLDLEARRAREITGPLREMFERRFHPDLI